MIEKEDIMLKKIRDFLASNRGRGMVYGVIILSSFIFAYLSFQSFQEKKNKVVLRPTQLNILEIIDTNKLVVAQHGVDYFINTGDYVAVVPYTVKAGFTLGDNLNSHITREGDTTVVRLPKPEILSVTTSDNAKPVVVKDGNPDPGLIKAMRIFGENYAKDIALQHNILEVTRKRGIDVLTSTATTLGIGENIRVEVEPADPEPQKVTIENDFLPIQVTVPKDFLNKYEIFAAKKGVTLIVDSFLIDRKNASTPSDSADIVGFVRVLQRETGSRSQNDRIRFFDPLHPEKIFGLLSHDVDEKRIEFFMHAGDRLYRIGFAGSSKKDCDTMLPDLMTFLYGLEGNSKNAAPCANLAGHTREDFKAMAHDEKARYFSAVDANNSLTRIFDNNKNCIITDHAGSYYKQLDEKGCLNQIKAAFDDLQQSLQQSNPPVPKDYYAILYNHNNFHRDRVMFFSDEGVAFYVPERMLQDKIAEFIPYADFFNRNKVNKEKNKYTINGEEIQSEVLNDYLSKSIDDGIIKLYDPNCN